MTSFLPEKPEDHSDIHFIGIGLVSAGLLLFLLGGLWTNSIITFKRKSVIIKATVLKKNSSGIGENETCAPVVRFRFQGRVHTHAFHNGASYFCYSKGSTFPVRVHRKGKKLDVRADDYLLLWPFLMMFAACCLLGLGVFSIKVVRNTREAQARGYMV